MENLEVISRKFDVHKNQKLSFNHKIYIGCIFNVWIIIIWFKYRQIFIEKYRRLLLRRIKIAISFPETIISHDGIITCTNKLENIVSNGQLLRVTWLFGNNELKYHGHSWRPTIASESISPLWWCVCLPDGTAPGLRSPAFFSFIYASIPLFCWLDLADLGLVLPCCDGALPTVKSPPSK